MSHLWFSLGFVLGLIGTTCAENFYVAAPATFRLNAVETIAVIVENYKSVIVDVYIQDHPGNIKNITHRYETVYPDKPHVFKFVLNPADFPSHFFNSPGSTKLVSVTAVTDKFRKEIIIPITTETGYVFIQMDKAIYTPDERAQMRIISLNEAALPTDKIFKLQILNPDDIIVEEKLFNNTAARFWKAFKTHIYKFPTYPVLGKWSATVRYGYEFQQSTTVSFELTKYVLPTFTVEVQTPDAILPTTDTFKIGVKAKHVHGKMVQGVVTFRIGVKNDRRPRTEFIVTSLKPNELNQGLFEEEIKTAILKNHKDIGWFPALDGSQLVVEATVVDYATGNNERTTNIKTRFSKSPLVISFKRCLSDFKPGLNSIFVAYITFVDGRVAAGISTKIKTKADGKELNIMDDSAISDDAGKVTFEIQTELDHATISGTLETTDPKYAGNQAISTFEQRKYQSTNGAYLAIARSTQNRLHPGNMFIKSIYFEPAGIRNIYYMIVSKGKIIGLHKLPSGKFKVQFVKFPITHEMVPSFRLLVFAHYEGEFIADSLKVEVERVCDPKAEVSVKTEFNANKPGSSGKISLRGSSGTWVGLLGIDEAVYALSKDNLLTKTKMFDKLASHDLGCGPGGGITVNQVLGNSGITIGTNKYTPPLEHTCVEIKRKKREAANNIGQRLVRQLGGDDFNELEFISAEEEDAYEWETLVRSDFRKTWIFEDVRIGSNGKRTFEVFLPDSITTWVISAVSVSEKNGMCVAEPQKIVSFKKIFLHLNLPYSVVRNEQVEVQATVFNYGNTLLPATVYIYGIKDVCTGSKQGKKGERKRLVVKPNSAESVAFTVIPLTTGIFRIKVVALSTEDSDVIEKYLTVVPEGVTKEIDIPISLDPSNQQRRANKVINTKQYSDSINSSQNLQVTAIKLAVPEGFVPETASASITAFGNQMGRVVETTINNPDGLLQKPHGCAEQNMMHLAPTLYTMKYLKVTGKTTAERETKGYDFIRTGYANQLTFRKEDGSYAPYQHRSTSTWLTASVIKVFCQANVLVHIDENVLCSGVRWLLNNQQPDGSYIEINPIYFINMMGGLQGKTPLTAFVLIALQECKCDEENILLVKKRATSYLENHLGDVNKPLSAAIVAYSLALSDSELKYAANEKLLAFAKSDEDTNRVFWETENSADDIQTAGYGLLTQLLLKDMIKSASIVNWLNSKQQQSGSFKSTQDTVVALQSLTEYAIQAQTPAISLVCNISLSNDEHFHEVLEFHEDNALVLQNVKIDEIGGTLFINTVGHGIGSMAVKLRYNVIVPPEDICKFDVKVQLSERTRNDGKERVARNIGFNDSQVHAEFDRFYPDRIRSINQSLAKSRVRRQNEVRNDKIKYIISICVKHLGKRDAEMSIVDVGIFSGFVADVKELKKLEEDPNHLIQRYERSSRGVVFYLQRVPIAEDYCFSFPIVREYIVGNTQRSVVKVYDYYNPDDACTKFYSPDTNSPILNTICEGGICACAGGGCPSEKVFADTASLKRDQRKKKIIQMVCNNYDYVWIGELNGPIKKEGEFLYILFTIHEVVKEGIEKIKLIEGESRTLLSRDNCEPMLPGQTYMIMGKDGQKYQNNEGVQWYRYILDQSSVVHRWTTIAAAKDPELQRALYSMVKSIRRNGCQS